MKMTRLLSTALLFLLPGAIATVYAQEHEQEKKPEQKQEQAKPAQRQQKAKPAKPAKQEAAREQKAQPAKQRERAASEQKAKPAQDRQRGQQAQANRGQASGGGHGSIPEAKFRASFGSGHTFHVNRSEWAGGSARFQYGGYWFNAVNPWPVGWLYTDAVYVDFLNGGYFLCDPVHPGVYISINIG